jgi:hypothetical protein
MNKNFLLSREMKVAICDAFGIDHTRHGVIDVSVSLVSNELATVSVKFVLTKEVVKIISEGLNKSDTET